MYRAIHLVCTDHSTHIYTSYVFFSYLGHLTAGNGISPRPPLCILLHDYFVGSAGDNPGTAVSAVFDYCYLFGVRQVSYFRQF